MRRRDFITLLAGAAVGWPFAAQAQKPTHRVGVLLPATSDDGDFQARLNAFLHELQQSGWSIGHNLHVDTRWAAGSDDEIRRNAAELATAAPDVILAHGASTVGPLMRATRTVPIVFSAVSDPVGAGFVDSLSRPGGNATGFMTYEYSIGGKWLQLLKDIVPRMTRTAVARDQRDGAGLGLYGAIQSMASPLGVELTPVNIRNTTEFERAIAALTSGNSGLVIPGSAFAIVHRNLIVTLAARYKVPAIYWDRAPVIAGGLMSYGPDFHQLYRQAAGYVDRILKSEKPADLPVQFPTKYTLALNLKTAKTLGLEVPPTLLALADEVIE